MENFLKLFLNSSDVELEVRFGTFNKYPITKIQMNDVVKKLKSLGFYSYNSQYLLKIQNQFIDSTTGATKMSALRTEISGMTAIKDYCDTNRIVNDDNILKSGVSFTKKSGLQNDGEFVKPLDFRDLNFRVSAQEEKILTATDGMVKATLKDWDNVKKTFRLMKRSSFYNDDYGFRFDISIVKMSKKTNYRSLIPEYMFLDSDCLNSQETYEIEIEALRSHTTSPTVAQLRRCIKIVLSGLQSSNFPIGFSEMDAVRKEYYELIHKSAPTRRIYPKDFIGPSSISLELEHIQPSTNNILTDFVATDKADGIRKLLYISKTGKIYLIDMNMNIQYVGMQSNDALYNSIIDGEHILHNKRKEYQNHYFAFDLYYLAGRDVRKLPFLKKDTECRLGLLNSIRKDILTGESPVFQVSVKTFYDNETIFMSCKTILEKQKEGLFNYELDGLIFTSKTLGVGQNNPTDKINNTKKTCLKSFKWKPPEFNTIDFLVTTKKTSAQDDVGNIFEAGISTQYGENIKMYKTLVLRVGFDETKHGYLNPFNMVINNISSDRSNIDRNDNYKPVPFYPTEPANPTTHLCKIILDSKQNMLIEDKTDKIEDNTIVEFRYDDTREEGFKWVPIRVRHDKTSEFRAGLKNFGNAYHVAQSVWHSIHNPISADIITSGMGIPEIVNYKYYNSKNDGRRFAIRDFHNLGIKRKLIQVATQPGNTLMDLSVGKGGDLSKWINAELSFVLGIDINKDNIENRINGACARYLTMKSRTTTIPGALFLKGDTSLSLRDGSAFTTDKEKHIMSALLGTGPKDAEKIGTVPLEYYGAFKDGFDVVSSQFSIHYYFKNEKTLHGFLQNVSDSCKQNGYFIGTCFDGKRMFRALQDLDKGKSISKHINNQKLFEVIKNYEHAEFRNDSSSLGYEIKVYQESINDYYAEYLVNFDYLTAELEKYGFKKLSRAELKQIGMSDSITPFKKEFDTIREMVSRNHRLEKNYGNTLNLNSAEQFVSFMNNMFIFKKVRRVVAPPGPKTSVAAPKPSVETPVPPVAAPVAAPVVAPVAAPVAAVEKEKSDVKTEQKTKKKRKKKKKIVLVEGETEGI